MSVLHNSKVQLHFDATQSLCAERLSQMHTAFWPLTRHADVCLAALVQTYAAKSLRALIRQEIRKWATQ